MHLSLPTHGSVHCYMHGCVVVDSLFIVALIVCGSFVFGPCFVLQYLVSFLVLLSSRWGRESWLLYSYCFHISVINCSVSFSHGALVCVVVAFSGHTHFMSTFLCFIIVF